MGLRYSQKMLLIDLADKFEREQRRAEGKKRKGRGREGLTHEFKTQSENMKYPIPPWLTNGTE